jgi:hypothetical protein
MDKFFTKKNCDRCGKDLQDGRIMSMFNEDCICMKCKDEETKHKDYNKARDREIEEVRKGNCNFKGIGFKDKKK